MRVFLGKSRVVDGVEQFQYRFFGIPYWSTRVPSGHTGKRIIISLNPNGEVAAIMLKNVGGGG